MKTLWKITIGMVSAIISCFGVMGGYALYAQDKFDFEDKVFDGYLIVKTAYHEEMNDYFNDKIDHMMDLMEEDEFWDHKDFKVPEGVELANYETLCVDNVSTYCVSMGALDRYIAYTRVLTGVTGYLITLEAEQSSQESLSKYEYIVKSEELYADISLELEQAKRVMQGTVAAYNEFRLAYPMHVKYEDIIFSLNKYKIALRDIREQVSSFPVKFVDATSVTCR